VESDAIDGSDWAVWLRVDPHGLGGPEDGAPVSSSAAYGEHRPVALRFTIASDGTIAVADLGDAAATC